jgi:hypothetical protein
VGSLTHEHCCLNIVIFFTPEYSRCLLKPEESPGSCEKLPESLTGPAYTCSFSISIPEDLGWFSRLM